MAAEHFQTRAVKHFFPGFVGAEDVGLSTDHCSQSGLSITEVTVSSAYPRLNR